MGLGEAALGDQAFDIAKAQGDAAIQPLGVADQLRREAVTSTQELH